MVIEIDSGSGFCFGVTRAISKAEEELSDGKTLYCLGDIVHNGQECSRLHDMGLITIDHEQFNHLHDATVLLRAHGEPPSTYETAKRNNLVLVDATCPVVLHLQERIKKEYRTPLPTSPCSALPLSTPVHKKGEEIDCMEDVKDKQIVIFGKNGHAEVLGLVGQTDGTAIVIEKPEEAEKLDFSRDICLYSQTTKSLDGFRKTVDYIQQHIQEGATFTHHDTICRQVANRMQHIRDFASRHDVVLFVCGKKSSNGRALFEQCCLVNPRSYMIDAASEIESRWLEEYSSVGICGATSTPKWLMEECKVRIEQLLGGHE